MVCVVGIKYSITAIILTRYKCSIIKLPFPLGMLDIK